MNEDFKLSLKRAYELFDVNIIEGFAIGTLKGLQQIHHYLFQDTFDFARQLRDVNIAKGNFRFAPIIFLEANLQIIDNMQETTFQEIIYKYVEMNVAHPFRKGNGRATRIWLGCMLKKNLNVCVDWSLIEKNDYLQAMEHSPVNSLEISTLLKTALSDDIHNREVLTKGIKKSYEYEGYYVI